MTEETKMHMKTVVSRAVKRYGQNVVAFYTANPDEIEYACDLLIDEYGQRIDQIFMAPSGNSDGGVAFEVLVTILSHNRGG